MHVKMTKTEKGSEDGRFVKEYRAGEEYDLPTSLAKAFIAMGAAEETKPAAPAVESRTEEPKARGKR
jgi:hypothetical protein